MSIPTDLSRGSEGRMVLHHILRDHEGTGPIVNGRLMPYVDTVGKTTIGIGRNITDCGISRVEALYLLDSDIDECLSDLQTFPWFNDLSTERKMAIVSLRFNLGPARFREWRATMAYLAAGDPAAAAAQFRTNSKYFGQVKRRAHWIADVLETGILV